MVKHCPRLGDGHSASCLEIPELTQLGSAQRACTLRGGVLIVQEGSLYAQQLRCLWSTTAEILYSRATARSTPSSSTVLMLDQPTRLSVDLNSVFVQCGVPAVPTHIARMVPYRRCTLGCICAFSNTNDLKTSRYELFAPTYPHLGQRGGRCVFVNVHCP